MQFRMELVCCILIKSPSQQMHLPVFAFSVRSSGDPGHIELLDSSLGFGSLSEVKRWKEVQTNMHPQMYHYYNSTVAKYWPTWSHTGEAERKRIQISFHFCLLHSPPTWWSLVLSCYNCELLHPSAPLHTAGTPFWFYSRRWNNLRPG